jgi:hypothetical protein
MKCEPELFSGTVVINANYYSVTYQPLYAQYGC